MQLWTEYEGATIDGAFPLKKLLLPEGRSAFFSTANGKGDPAVLRLIECHFDEEEILARWRTVEALNHPNFLRLERYGKIVLDGGPVVYAVFEKTDANLAEVLAGGRLTVADAKQLAISLASALEMLHANGFVHEHLQPGNIFAVGEVVKMRSDCIREAPEGEAALIAKRRDVHDLAVVQLQALTQAQTLDRASEAALPAPFDELVRNGMSGAWGLAEIRAALEGGRWASRVSRLAPGGSRPAPRAAVAPPAVPPAPKPPSSSKPNSAATWTNNIVRSAVRQEVWRGQQRDEISLRSKWIGVGALVLVVMLMAAWLLAHGGKRHENALAHAASSLSIPRVPVLQNVAPPRVPARKSPAAATAKSAGARAQWRVIAYTYHREDQARKKAEAIAQKHPGLRPVVFAPSGHSPYLVTVGGVMSKDAAFALARKCRSGGLPRDTYAQNYSGAR